MEAPVVYAGGLSWKDYLIIALVQALIVGGLLFYLDKRYPAMSTYVDQVAGQIVREVQQKALIPMDERLKKLEGAAGPAPGAPKR